MVDAGHQDVGLSVEDDLSCQQNAVGRGTAHAVVVFVDGGSGDGAAQRERVAAAALLAVGSHHHHPPQRAQRVLQHFDADAVDSVVVANEDELFHLTA